MQGTRKARHAPYAAGSTVAHVIDLAGTLMPVTTTRRRQSSGTVSGGGTARRGPASAAERLCAGHGSHVSSAFGEAMPV